MCMCMCVCMLEWMNKVLQFIKFFNVMRCSIFTDQMKLDYRLSCVVGVLDAIFQEWKAVCQYLVVKGDRTGWEEGLWVTHTQESGSAAAVVEKG